MQRSTLIVSGFVLVLWIVCHIHTYLQAQKEVESFRSVVSQVDYGIRVPTISPSWTIDPPRVPSFDVDRATQQMMQDTDRRMQQVMQDSNRAFKRSLDDAQRSLRRSMEEDQRRAQTIRDITRRAGRPGGRPSLPATRPAGTRGYPSYAPPQAAGLVAVVNPGLDAVAVRLVCQGRGAREFSVAPRGSFALPGPAGSYQAFFIFASLPGQIFQGDDFRLSSTSLVRITLTPGGSYRLRRVQ